MKSLKIKNQNGNVKSKILSFSSVIFHFDISILHLKGLSFFILIFAFYILALPKQASAAVSNLGLVGYWSMNEGTGTVAGDASGNNNRGILTNGPTWVDGKRGKALNFDGSNDFVNVANESNFDFERTQSFTLAAWVKRSSIGTYDIIIQKNINDGSTYRGWAFQITSGNKLHVEILNNNAGGNLVSVDGGTSLSANVWYHALATYDGSSTASGIKMYLNGVLETNTVITNALSATILNNEAVRIANWSGDTSLFGGLIDEVRVYKRALSAAEIQSLYKSGAQKFTAPPTNLGLVGYWSMNEGTGTIAGDASGNNNRGILTNGPTWVDGKRGKALNFDGSNDYVDIGDSTSLEPTTAFSISAWIKRSADIPSSGGVIQSRKNTSSERGWILVGSVGTT